MDRDGLLARIYDKADETSPVINQPQNQQKRRGVVRRPQKPKTESPMVSPTATPETPQMNPVDINALLDQISEILAQETTVVSKNESENLADLEETLSEIIRENSSFGVNWHPDHLSACSCQTCDISRITVVKYTEHNHLCVYVRGEHICTNPMSPRLHNGPVKKDDKNYYLCEKTGMVHQCGDMCRADKDLTNQDNEYVCPISGIVLGVEMKGEWWTEKDKQMDLEGSEPEMDQDALQVQTPHYITKRTYDANGKMTETVECAVKNITVTHHLHYHNHPFEKKYWYYLMRCKNILWLIIYSPKRLQIERKRLITNYQNMEKSIDKYIRNCEKNEVPKNFRDMCAIVRYHMKPRTDMHIWPPPLRIMEPLLFRYARIVVKFFLIILEKTPYGRSNHTKFPFDYFVLATVNIMRQRGLQVKGDKILPKDEYLATHIPDPSLLHHFGIQLNFMTNTKTHINKAIGSTDAKLLKVTVTNQDAGLFQDVRERRIIEHRELQEKQRREVAFAVPDQPSPNKRKKR